MSASGCRAPRRNAARRPCCITLGRDAEAMAPLVEAERRAKRMDRHERAKQADMYAWAAETLAELREERGQAGG